MNNYQTLSHSFEPVFDGNSEVLILGTFPSVKSRENHFYYGHPQNRFWKVLAAIANAPVPASIPEKKQLLLSRGIALWDVIQSCDIIGSSDSSIRNVMPADIPWLLRQAPISAIFGNGAKACELFQKYTQPLLEESFPDGTCTKAPCAIHKLPSTSPANAAWKLERLVDYWKQEIMAAQPETKVDKSASTP